MTTTAIDPKSTSAGNTPASLVADPSPPPYEAVRFNVLKHGILSRYTVLSHENHADYECLVNSLMDEPQPAGATEQHLIEELVSVTWRKRRVQGSKRTSWRCFPGPKRAWIANLIALWPC